MGVYIHFTEEQKRRANQVDLEDFLRRRGEELIKSGPEYRLKSNHSITVRGNAWFDHSKSVERGGMAISFLQNFYDCTYPEAVTILLNGEQGEAYQPAEEKKSEPKKPFALPIANPDMRRVYAYLIKTRLIDRDVINAFAQRGLIYESCEINEKTGKEYHNAVFVGLDEHGVARHAHKRGIYTQGDGYKGNVDSSDPAYSFHWIGTSGGLYVFEAPIDLLSYITLHPNDWQRHSYVALCGVSEQAMLKLLELYPDTVAVGLCLDHDPAGIEAAEKFSDILTARGIRWECGRSIQKDWNEDIKAAKGQAALPAKEHPQLLLRDEVCCALVDSALDVQEIASHGKLMSLLESARSHLHLSQFPDEATQLTELLNQSAGSAALAYSHAPAPKDLVTLTCNLFSSYRTYENHGKVKGRLALLEKAMLPLQAFENKMDAAEQERLAQCYEDIAAHCLKAVILMEQGLQKITQHQQPMQMAN